MCELDPEKGRSELTVLGSNSILATRPVLLGSSLDIDQIVLCLFAVKLRLIDVDL